MFTTDRNTNECKYYQLLQYYRTTVKVGSVSGLRYGHSVVVCVIIMRRLFGKMNRVHV